MTRFFILLAAAFLPLLCTCSRGEKTWCGVQAYPRVRPESALDPHAMKTPRKHPESFFISTADPSIRICTQAAPGEVELRVRRRDGQEQRLLLNLGEAKAPMACVTAQGCVSTLAAEEKPAADWILLVVPEAERCYMIWNPATGGANRRFEPTGPATSPIYAHFTLTQNPRGYFIFHEQ